MRDFEEICEYHGATGVTTTTSRTGYPSELKIAYYLDTRTELEELKADLLKEGVSIEEILIRKKRGWDLWYRDSCYHNDVDWTKGQDWFISLNMDDTEEGVKEEIKYFLFSDDFDHIEEVGLDKVNDAVDSFYDEVKRYQGVIDVFVSQNDLTYIETISSQNDTGWYDGDVTSYQMAIREL